MMDTPHLGEAGVHPVIASSARELLNKSENERSGVLSTAMSFLGLYRDPVVARVTARCDWRIADLVGSRRPVTLYLVVPPSDINRTKPLIRLILNQIGRRLTEELTTSGKRHRLLLMLDEFPALGRLDFFESALAFMAGYGIKGFLIAQSLNQIERAYGPNNAILDNCHVRVSFATNDERTAKRVSDALGAATELRDSTNYAGHRLAPWLGHLMVSRQETARPLLTPGEIMQLPPTDEIVMVAGTPPIRATKARYFEDARFQERILTPPKLVAAPLTSSPLDFIARLAALVPKPRVNLTRFHGVFAPNSRHRALVTPAKRGRGNKVRVADEPATPAQRRASMTWAQRLKRVFNIDIETCSGCGGAMKVIACIEDPIVIKQILDHLKHKAETSGTRALPESRAPPAELLLGLFD
nr:putative transposase [Klebsiella pneumoniae]